MPFLIPPPPPSEPTPSPATDATPHHSGAAATQQQPPQAQVSNARPAPTGPSSGSHHCRPDNGNNKGKERHVGGDRRGGYQIANYEPILKNGQLPARRSRLRRTMEECIRHFEYRVMYQSYVPGEDGRTMYQAPGAYETREQGQAAVPTVISALLAAEGVEPGDVKATRWQDEDAVPVIDAALADGRFFRVWAERYSVTALPVPEEMADEKGKQVGRG